jgi:N-acetylmuramoyl-L-alanine amidase
VGDSSGALGLFAALDTGRGRDAVAVLEDEQHGTPVVRRVLDRPPMQQMPIIWNEERMALTAEHLEHHLGMTVTDDLDASTRMDPKMVVLHWTAGPTAKSAFWTFFSPRRKRKDPHHQLNLSVHFIVDRDGSIFQLMPTDRIAAHVVGLNHLAIGIENVGDRRRWPLTPAQVTANIALVRFLAQKHDLTHLIGHYEFKRFHGHGMWKGPEGHHIGRADPGEAFMAQVRSGVQDLGLAGAPPKPGRSVARRPLARTLPPAALVRAR